MAKLQKKQYIYCSKCNTYTRLKKIRVAFNSFGFPLFHPAFQKITSLIFDRPSYSGEKCKKCSETSNLEKVFLETEIDEKGEELAFISPSGEKINLISDN
ncbi:MAG: hypothetical protein Q8P20_04525 [bacterium]|nr:hypothetical protein [bacterium]